MESTHLLKKGFLLIEVMTALMAFAGLAILIARYQVLSMRQAKEAQNYLQAVTLGCDMLEEASFDNTLNSKHPFKVTRERKDFIVPAQFKKHGLNTESLSKMKTVSVHVTWNSMDQSGKNITLESVQADTTRV